MKRTAPWSRPSIPYLSLIHICNSQGQETPATEEPGSSAGNAAEETTPPQQDGESDILIAYFSWADNAVIHGEVDVVASPSVTSPGNVQQLAGWVQEETGGALFSIQVTEPYSSDWDECLERANGERAENARPELTASVENMESYDTIFLGSVSYTHLDVYKRQHPGCAAVPDNEA